MKNAALLDKINARLAILGRSASNVSRAATGDPSTIRRMQRASPTLDTLQAIADELGLSLSDLLSASAEASAPPQLLLPAPGAPAAVLEQASSDYMPDRQERDVPIYGTALGQPLDDSPADLHSVHVGEIIDYAPRPPKLSRNRRCYF